MLKKLHISGKIDHTFQSLYLVTREANKNDSAGDDDEFFIEKQRRSVKDPL